MQTITKKLNHYEEITSRDGFVCLDAEKVASLRTALENEQRELERSLTRLESTIEAIEQLVWPECTDVQQESPEYLTKLVTRVGMLVRLTQSWDVLQRHVRANRVLAEQNRKLREELRFATAKCADLAVKVVVLEDEIEVIGAAYEQIRTQGAAKNG